MLWSDGVERPDEYPTFDQAVMDYFRVRYDAERETLKRENREMAERLNCKLNTRFENATRRRVKAH